MKTTINIRNMKKMTMTMCAALIFVTAGLTQQSEVYTSDVKASLDRLENYTNSLEQAAKFVVPAVSEVAEVSDEMNRLERLAATAEKALKYTAPAVYEENEFYADVVSPEIERLEMLASAIEESLRYEAPEVNEIPEMEPIKTNNTIILLAQETLRGLK
jgi:tetrahydromethanopterin S-methyltransferase subunit B